MAPVSAASQWNELGKLFYRKRDLYRMLWKGVNLEQSLIVCANYGGPIAVVRDDRKLAKLGASQV
jgi:hypothetical protein